MQGAEERRLRRMSNTPQGEAIDCPPGGKAIRQRRTSAADDALMVNQGAVNLLDKGINLSLYWPGKNEGYLVCDR